MSEAPQIPGVVINQNGVNPLVALARNILKEAEAGTLGSMAVILVARTGGVAVLMEGPQAGDLYVGAGMVQSRIMRGIENPQQVQRIIPARGNGLG